MTRRFLFLLAALFSLVALPAQAQSIVIHWDHDIPRVRPHPRPPRRPAIRPIELRDHRVEITIEGQLAKYKVTQEFFNPNHQQLEGTYLFPLPAGASISSFAMTMNGQMVSGEILDQDKARKIYEDIVRKMRDPGLLEYVDDRCIRARVFPILPKQPLKIAFEFAQVLSGDAGLVSLRYPLRAQGLAEMPAPPRVTVDVTIHSKVPIKSLFSTTHPIDKTALDRQPARVTYEGRATSAHEDFVLHYLVSKEDFGLNFLTHRLSGEDGFFLAQLAPDPADDGVAIPKDIAFVLDTSGSMSGPKMEQARRALAFVLNNLGPEDRYNIIPFSTEARPFHETPVTATKDTIETDLFRVSQLRAAGGTNIDEAIALGLRGLSRDGRLPMVVFLTDGQPTIGETDPKKILVRAHDANKTSSRLFVFGVGSDVNTMLLDRLAEDSHGTREYVTEKEDIEFKVSSFYDKISHPVLSDVSIEIAGAEVLDVYPKRMPDLFKGSQITVLGRYRSPGTRVVRLRGTYRGKQVESVYQVNFPDRQLDHEEIRTIWAKRKVGYLLDQIRLNGANKELTDEIVRLGKTYGIVTPYTSYLILEDNALAQRGTTSLDFLLSTSGTVPTAARTPTVNYVGGREVEASRRLKSLRDADSIRGRKLEGKAAEAADSIQLEMGKARVRTLAGKTFLLRAGVWIDTAIPAKTEGIKEVEVEAYSTAYFALIKKVPRLEKAFSLGERVRVMEGEVIYVVVPAKVD